MVRQHLRHSRERAGSRQMVRLALLTAAAALCASAAEDTTAARRYDGVGYVTFGVGRCQHQVTNVSVGGGGQAFLWKGLALGGDIGYFQFVEQGGRGFGIGGLNVGYHFVNRNKPARFDPFVYGSPLGAGFARGGLAGAGSLGGGLNYWFKPRIGLRTEVRVQGFAEEAMVMFHIGLSFR